MKRLIFTTLLVVAICSLGLSERVSSQDAKPAAKPNFTGTWKANLEKSDFGLSQDGKTLKIARHYAGPEGEADATYVMDKQ